MKRQRRLAVRMGGGALIAAFAWLTGVLHFGHPTAMAQTSSRDAVLKDALANTGSTGNQNSEQAEQAVFAVTDPANLLIPQRLLPVIHAVEVQQDLNLTPPQLEKLEHVLATIDQTWWPARNLTPDQQRTVTAQLEDQLLQRIASELSIPIVNRLQQIEMQAQGPRLMLRPDIAQHLQLSDEQKQKFQAFARKSEAKIVELNQPTLEIDEKQRAGMLSASKQEEVKLGYELLNTDQKKRLTQLLGKLLDFSTMQRIYPLAPELIDSPDWFGTPITSLRALKGKVVVIHFYAFECHNCQNNFSRYDEWVEKFRDQDVVFLGIQTPETSAEARPNLVKDAATENKFQFPVLIDLEHKNWQAWGNTMWPTVYVVDRKGYIRMWWLGELNWQGATGDQTVADAINRLLRE